MPNEDKKYFIPANDRLIEVSKEVYRDYYRPIWRTRYRAQRNGECTCTKGQVWRCDGVCPGCEFYAAGEKVSTNTPIGDEEDGLTLEDTLADETPSTESILIEKELLNALYEELDRLDPEGKRICQLFMEGHSEREVANQMRMPRSTFKRHWAKLQAKLREKLEDFYR